MLGFSPRVLTLNLTRKRNMRIPKGSTVYLLSPGDARHTAANACWPMQKETLESVEKLFSGLQFKTNRVWGVDPATRGNEFIMGQNEGILAVEKIPQDAPVVLVMSCWAFADHLAAPLANHRGPILMLGNFDGTWPGLVALLNHSATFWRLGIKHSRAWSETFDDDFLISALGQWFESGEIKYSTSHV